MRHACPQCGKKFDYEKEGWICPFCGSVVLASTEKKMYQAEQLKKAFEEGAELLKCDTAACNQLGVEVVNRPIATVANGYVRHDPGHLARELILLHAERSVRIAGDSFDYRDDTYRVERR